MLYFFSGTPGSGKSLHAAKMIDAWYRNGKNIISNFPINMNFWKKKKNGQILYLDPDELTVDYLIQFADENHQRDKKGNIIEKQTLLIIDECQTMFNSRSWNSRGRDVWVIFFTQHRKYGYEVVLISQDKCFVDKQIRAVFEYNYVHRDIRNFKIFGRFLSFFTGGHLFLCVQQWMSTGQKDSSYFLFGMKKYYDLYDSYKIFNYKGLRPLSEEKFD